MTNQILVLIVVAACIQQAPPMAPPTAQVAPAGRDAPNGPPADPASSTAASAPGATDPSRCAATYTDQAGHDGKPCTSAPPCDYADGTCSCAAPPTPSRQGSPRWSCSKKLSACPATFQTASSLAVDACTWTGAGDGCSYPEGHCSCKTATFCGGAYREPSPPAWTCQRKVAGCPDVAPQNGDACAKRDARCRYGCTTASCEHGKWAISIFAPP